MSTVFFSISYEDFNVTDCKVRTYLRVSVNYPQFITHDPVLGYSIFLFPSISFHFFCEFFQVCTRRAEFQYSEAASPCYRGQQPFCKMLCPEVADLVSKARSSAPYYALSRQHKAARPANGSPLLGELSPKVTERVILPRSPSRRRGRRRRWRRRAGRSRRSWSFRQSGGSASS